MSLLTDAADWFKARQTNVTKWFDDDTGRYAFIVTVDGQQFIVTAKKYLKDGNASFMARKVVQRAIDRDAYILLFVKNRKLVFDPVTVDERGEHGATAREDRRKKGEDWVDIDVSQSVGFRDWYDHGEQPPGPPDPGEPDRPWDITSWGEN